MGITAKFVIVASAFFGTGAALVDSEIAPFGNDDSFAAAGIFANL